MIGSLPCASSNRRRESLHRLLRHEAFGGAGSGVVHYPGPAPARCGENSRFQNVFSEGQVCKCSRTDEARRAEAWPWTEGGGAVIDALLEHTHLWLTSSI
eukprot:531606-Prymnesium_polylepis.1